jgi:hypothetical protein
MYMHPATEDWKQAPARTPAVLAVAVVVVVLLTIGIGLFPSEVIQFAQAGK